MCFSVPLKVLTTRGQTAVVEGGLNIRLGRELRVKPGDYVRVVGRVAVDKLTRNQGARVRQLISSLNTPYVA